MRIYDYDALNNGPIDFSRIIQGDEEMDPQILVLHMEYFAPAQ
jgi:hypothetical protein